MHCYKTTTSTSTSHTFRELQVFHALRNFKTPVHLRVATNPQESKRYTVSIHLPI